MNPRCFVLLLMSGQNLPIPSGQIRNDSQTNARLAHQSDDA